MRVGVGLHDTQPAKALPPRSQREFDSGRIGPVNRTWRSEDTNGNQKWITAVIVDSSLPD